MKLSLLSGFLVLISSFCFGQTIAVSGSVTDDKGKPVPFAFISDSQHPYATFSDANGSFSLKVDPASILIATANFHQKTRAKLDNPTNIKIVMPEDLNNSGPVASTTTKNIFVQDESLVNATAGSLTLIGSGQENLHGSRFLFNNWVHGFAVSPNDSVKQNDLYLFNYDKIDGNLIFTRNKTTVFQVVKDEIKGFTLFDDNAQTFVFEDVQAVDKKHYLQVIAAGKKYKIYKNLGTKFIKANFSTNGISSTGNNYDEYADESTYYVVKLPAGTPEKISLRKKAIKTALIADADKVNKYFSDNDKDIDEEYLKGLIDYLDQ